LKYGAIIENKTNIKVKALSLDPQGFQEMMLWTVISKSDYLNQAQK
jgi:hypothetical protein